MFNGTVNITDATEQFINSSNNYYREFNPGCNYEAGNQTWFFEINDSPAYTFTIGPASKVQIFGNITANYTTPINLEEFEVGTNIVFNGNLIDDCNKKSHPR